MPLESLSATMILRITASLLLALLIVGAAGYLRRRNPQGLGGAGRLAVRLLGGLSMGWIGVWLCLAAVRFVYPHELEWVGGAVLDHCRRVASGAGIYVAPSRDWVPFMYGPLYYWICAPLVTVWPEQPLAAMRAVSVGTAIGIAVVLYVWVGRTTRFEGGYAGVWPLAAVGLMFAAYRMTGAWYDVERIDSLFVFCGISALALVSFALSHRRGSVRLAGALVLLLAAFLTKQQGLAFGLAAAAAMMWHGNRKGSILFASALTVLCFGAAALLTWRTDGWYWEYAVRQPGRLGWEAGLALQFLLDALLLAPSLALLLAAYLGGARLAVSSEENRTMLCGLAAAWLVSLVSRARWGGDQNVLIPCFLFTFACAAVMAARLAHIGGAFRALAAAALLAQMLVLTYNPLEQVPTAAGMRAGQAFRAVLQREEEMGRVLCLDHGGLLRKPNPHILALRDWLAAGNALPLDFARALRERHWSAIVTDGLPDPLSPLYAEVLRNYAPAELCGITERWTLTGYPTPSPERPVWILRPRTDSANQDGVRRKIAMISDE